MMKTKVSVIMPVYNVEKYMKKSLNSLKQQTLKEVEFICIDDGSKDSSLNILRQFAKEDNRFKIYTQANKGAGTTRNIGMKYAQGEYITFVDADDWIAPNTIETLYNQAQKQGCDMVVFDYQTVEEGSGKILQEVSMKNNLKDVHNLKPENTFNWQDIKSKVFGGLFYASWNKLYKRSFLEKNKIHFTPCSMSEDNAFVFDATLRANKIGYNDKAKYNYLMRNSSAVHKISDKNFCIFQVVDAAKSVLKRCGLEKTLSKEFDEYIEDTMHYHYKRVKSRDKYAKMCSEKLSLTQNNAVQKKLSEQNIVFRKISEIIDSLQKQN